MIIQAARTVDVDRTRAQRSRVALVWRQFRRNRAAVVGGCVVIVLALMALFAHALAPYDPILVLPDQRLQPPSGAHPFGTDELGRDVLSRAIFGARISMTVGLISVTVALVIGVTLGLVSGYLGGWADNVIMRVIDVLLAFPGILLAIVIAGALGPGLRNVMIAVGIFSMPSYARVVRASTLSVKEQDYIEALRALGASDPRIVFRHILTNVFAPIIVLATLGIATAILSAAGLSFVGLGAQPPTPEWGAMLSQARPYLRNEWWMATFPGLAIMITVLAVNLLGDGLRDALDPRLRT
ncbi:MAG: nickel transporter permease [Armatimonadota bacterium]